MSTSFIEIYDRAITEFDDPNITKVYNLSQISFFQVMYNYLINAIPAFNNPQSVRAILASRTDPSGYTEIFNGDGITTTFTLSTTPLANSYFEYQINNVVVVGNYDSITNQITFPSPIPSGHTGSVQWYFAGEFTNTLDDTMKSILAKLLVLHWAEKEKNFLLDIRRLLNDTDFKLNDNSSTTRSKIQWYENIRENAEKLMNQYSWILKFSK